MPGLPQRAQAGQNLASTLKTCPRCLGDLVLQRHPGGDYFACLQCGFRLEPGRRTSAK